MNKRAELRGKVAIILIAIGCMIIVGIFCLNIGKSVGELSGYMDSQMQFYKNNKRRDSALKELEVDYKNAQLRFGIDKNIIGSYRVHDSLYFILKPDTVKIVLK